TLDNPNALKEWNGGNLDFLLLQPSSAGHGLNLQKGGHIAIWYSLANWNLELYQQANTRIYRQGQKEKVTIYHLLAKGTLDQVMLKALKAKEVTQKDLLEALRA
ncbi:MAG: ATP-dependent helicase, partial [Allobaculum sp.]|nr:ATP-dependent helicase [Allobaculum sp.]